MKAPDHRTVSSACIGRRREVWDVRKLAILLLATAFLITLPAGIRLPTDSEAPVIGLATAMADDDDDDAGDDDDDDGGGDDDASGGDDDDDGGGDDDSSGGDDDDGGGGDDDSSAGDDDDDASGGDDDASGDDDDGSASDRDTGQSGAPDRDRGESDDRGGPEDRGASSREIGSRPGDDRTVVIQNSPAVGAIGQAVGQRHSEPGMAPTDASTARSRAMVEIARELGAPLADISDQPPISGVVTQEMLSAAERRYVETVREAWEAHGFPWNDSEVLQSLNELDALVSALERIMHDVDGASPGTHVATDFNQDGFVDINDLWDAYWR